MFTVINLVEVVYVTSPIYVIVDSRNLGFSYLPNQGGLTTTFCCGWLTKSYYAASRRGGCGVATAVGKE